MRRLLKGGQVVNVFIGSLEACDVLMEDDRIIGVGSYEDADVVEDVTGKIICPGFIDGHIHIESTMMTPSQLAKAVLPHGTTTIVSDPHEIANVCGTEGIRYMLEASKGLPLSVYFMLPSCVPAADLDESGAVLTAEDLRPFYQEKRVLGLAEMMNYPGVIAQDEEILKKIADAKSVGKVIDGHAPLLSGKELDSYIAAGIYSDHECSNAEEAKEKIKKGQFVMLRQGSAAKNLEAMLELFDMPWCERCLLATDDIHPEDLVKRGHIDHLIQLAVGGGKTVMNAIRMASYGAAQYFGLRDVGAVAPGYRADVLVLEDLGSLKILDVYAGGRKAVSGGFLETFEEPTVTPTLQERVLSTFHIDTLSEQDFYIEGKKGLCRVIGVIPNQLLTEERHERLDFSKNNGIDVSKDILKIAVLERHKRTGHKGLGFISGLGIEKGAVASSVSHDSHNLVVVGTNDRDMALAANHVLSARGGSAVALDGKVISSLALPIAGLMSEKTAETIAEENEAIQQAVQALGCCVGGAPLMTMAFMSLSVIPSLKMTTQGLVDVNTQTLVSLFVEDEK